MADGSDKSAIEQIVEVLLRHGVRFMVVGGQAEWLMGSPRATFDVDICYERSTDNMKCLAEALEELGVRLRGAPPGVPFKLDPRTIGRGCNFTFITPIIDLDVLGHIEPIGGYEQLAQRGEEYTIGDFNVQTISLDDLIRVKEHIARDKDSESLHQLRAIKQVREEQERDGG